MSPQVLLGDPYTIKCDVWSLGVVFYKMLYNIYPWEKTDNIMVLTKRMKENIEFPPKPKVSDWIKEMIRGMLTIDESKRYYISEVKKIILGNTGLMDIE